MNDDAKQQPVSGDWPAQRTPEEIKRDGNRLIDEPSLYLQQHAHNPLDWYPWGELALERAKSEDKPIFLSIGYSSCHWCHVMEHEVFEHDDVAAYMNEQFICIKVDREERPDLDSVYMDAVQLMTGRGGWPMSVFMTPELKPFFGATYIPKQQFMNIAAQIIDVYTNKRGELDAQANEVAKRISSAPMDQFANARAFDPALIDAAVARAKESFDEAHGGLQQTQKFPTPVKWRYLLHEYRRRGDDEVAAMITASLDAMQGGGIYDHVGGGFHRYTVDPEWTVPHFEKMLYDNGQMAGLFIEAGVVFDRADYLATGLDVLDFLMERMRDPEGAFYASYDADSGGEEGTYYVWSPAELAEVAGPEDGPVLAAVLGVSAEGNFENTGKSVLTYRADLDAVAERFGRSRDEVAGLPAKYRTALQEVRDRRVPPGLDRKIVTSWNGLVISSLAQAAAATGDTKYLEAGMKAADFLLKQHRHPDGSLIRTSSEGRTRAEGVLDDYAFFADALLALYQVSGQSGYLEAARELIDFARAEFTKPEGGYYMSRVSVDAPLGRSVDFYDSVEPSGNSVMLTNLIQLGAITGETVYTREAREHLETWSGLLERAGLEMAWWFDAATRLEGPYYDVVIAGDPAAEDTRALTAALLSRLPASSVISQVAADGPDADLLKIAPALAGKKAVDGAATVYVCEFGTCQAPTSNTDVMMKQVMTGWVK